MGAAGDRSSLKIFAKIKGLVVGQMRLVTAAMRWRSPALSPSAKEMLLRPHCGRTYTSAIIRGVTIFM
jgi:hypothetical protein